MTPHRISLDRWLTQTYGEDAPHISTARRWIRDKKIYPPPEKHGRSYFVVPDARYTDRPIDKPRLVDKLRAAETQA